MVWGGVSARAGSRRTLSRCHQQPPRTIATSATAPIETPTASGTTPDGSLSCLGSSVWLLSSLLVLLSVGRGPWDSSGGSVLVTVSAGPEAVVAGWGSLVVVVVSDEEDVLLLVLLLLSVVDDVVTVRSSETVPRMT